MEGHSPRTASQHPRGMQPPAGHAHQRNSTGPRHPHTRANSTLARTPTARAEGRQPGEEERLTSDAPHSGAGHPPRGCPPAIPPARDASAQERMQLAWCWVPRAHTTRARDTRATRCHVRPQGRAAGRGTAPDTRRPSQRRKAIPAGQPPTNPAARSPPQGGQAKKTVPGPHARTPAPTARGQRTPTACREGGQRGEEERLTSDAPHNGARHPPPRDSLPPPPQRATPSRKSADVRPVLGPPCPHQPCPGHTGNGSWPPAPKDGRPGEGKCLTPDAPLNGGGPAPRDSLPSAPRHAAPRRASTPKGRCRAPTSAYPRPQHVGGRPRPPAPRTGSRGRASTRPKWRKAAPGDNLLQPPQRATLARKSARRGAGAGPPVPRLPVPGTHGQRVVAARPQGRAARRGKAPDAGRPSQRLEAMSPGRPPTTPVARCPCTACTPKGQCRAPKPAQPSPQHAGLGPRQPAPRVDSRGRTHTCPQTPLTMARGTPPGDAPRHPHSAQRRLARAHAVGPVLGPPRPHRPLSGNTANRSWLPAARDRRPGEGKRLTPDAPHNGGRSSPGTASHHPHGMQPPAGHARQRDSAGPPRPHARAHGTWAADLNCRPPRGG